MPKIIIGNAYELYDNKNETRSDTTISQYYFYNLRFLWLLSEGDIIILPKSPSPIFLAHLTQLKGIDLNKIHLIILENYAVIDSQALLNADLFTRLKKIIAIPKNWSIQCCYYTKEILQLAKKLQLPISEDWEKLILKNYPLQFNSKIIFRELAAAHNIPITEGLICYSETDFTEAFTQYILVTGQIILKQEFGASGKGNIGVGLNCEPEDFVGVKEAIIISQDECFLTVAKRLWQAYASSKDTLIMEVYYPNKGTFTAQFFVPKRGELPWLLNYSEIKMAKTWHGIQMPPRDLSSTYTFELITYSNQLANILQGQGYQGYICCDAILTDEDRLLFTEMNVRPGAETHAYILSQHLFGAGFEKKITVRMDQKKKGHTLAEIYKRLAEKKLLINKENKYGIVIMTINDEMDYFEYLVAGKDEAQHHLFLQQMDLSLGDN